MNRNEFQELTSLTKKLRRTILSIIVDAHASHIASSYSIIEILVYLYEKVLHIDPDNPLDSQRDRFILSKGWGVSALYTILVEKGFIDEALLKTYCKNGSKLIGSATRNGIPGIEATTGSMGHGLPIGIGMAMAARIKGLKYRVFVLMSDGECDEGSTWEAILQAGHHELDNLIVIIDYNKWQSFGKIKDILDLEPFKKKWEAFKWGVKEIDGHDFNEISKAFTKFPLVEKKPTIIIAHTKKGKGVSSFEDKNDWHYKTPTEKEIEVARKELSE